MEQGPRTPNNFETKSFSTKFIEERIRGLLSELKEISNVKSVEVKGNNKEIDLAIKITAKGFDVKVSATLGNENNLIIVKRHTIEANILVKGKAKEAIEPQLSKISDLLKKYIETEESREVEKIEIENGQLKVTFKKKGSQANENILETTPKKVVIVGPFFREITKIALRYSDKGIIPRIPQPPIINEIIDLYYPKITGSSSGLHYEVDQVLYELEECGIIKNHASGIEVLIKNKEELEKQLNKFDLKTWSIEEATNNQVEDNELLDKTEKGEDIFYPTSLSGNQFAFARNAEYAKANKHKDAFYQITAGPDDTATFTLINDKKRLIQASRLKSAWLDPACTFEGEGTIKDALNLDWQITPGKLKKIKDLNNNDVWIIQEKVKVKWENKKEKKENLVDLSNETEEEIDPAILHNNETAADPNWERGEHNLWLFENKLTKLEKFDQEDLSNENLASLAKLVYDIKFWTEEALHQFKLPEKYKEFYEKALGILSKENIKVQKVDTYDTLSIDLAKLKAEINLVRSDVRIGVETTVDLNNLKDEAFGLKESLGFNEENIKSLKIIADSDVSISVQNPLYINKSIHRIEVIKKGDEIIGDIEMDKVLKFTDKEVFKKFVEELGKNREIKIKSIKKPEDKVYNYKPTAEEIDHFVRHSGETIGKAQTEDSLILTEGFTKMFNPGNSTTLDVIEMGGFRIGDVVKEKKGYGNMQSAFVLGFNGNRVYLSSDYPLDYASMPKRLNWEGRDLKSLSIIKKFEEFKKEENMEKPGIKNLSEEREKVEKKPEDIFLNREEVEKAVTEVFKNFVGKFDKLYNKNNQKLEFLGFVKPGDSHNYLEYNPCYRLKTNGDDTVQDIAFRIDILFLDGNLYIGPLSRFESEKTSGTLEGMGKFMLRKMKESLATEIEQAIVAICKEKYEEGEDILKIKGNKGSLEIQFGIKSTDEKNKATLFKKVDMLFNEIDDIRIHDRMSDEEVAKVMRKVIEITNIKADLPFTPTQDSKLQMRKEAIKKVIFNKYEIKPLMVIPRELEVWYRNFNSGTTCSIDNFHDFESNINEYFKGGDKKELLASLKKVSEQLKRDEIKLEVGNSLRFALKAETKETAIQNLGTDKAKENFVALSFYKNEVLEEAIKFLEKEIANKSGKAEDKKGEYIEFEEVEDKNDGTRNTVNNTKIENPDDTETKGEKEVKSDLKIKKDEIEARREEALDLMLKEKAVEITENDFELEFVGVPQVFDSTIYFGKEKIQDLDFYQSLYDGSRNYAKSFSLLRRPSGKVFYMYKIPNLISELGRGNSFFAMSLELDDIYCTDFAGLEEFFDEIFEKIIVERYGILKKIDNPEQPYKFNITTFNSSTGQKALAEVKAIILKYFKDKKYFGNDFRKSDENFNKAIANIGRFYTLHQTPKAGTSTGEIRSFNSNHFDFDRNAINEKYDKELAKLTAGVSALEKEEKTPEKGETKKEREGIEIINVAEQPESNFVNRKLLIETINEGFKSTPNGKRVLNGIEAVIDLLLSKRVIDSMTIKGKDTGCIVHVGANELIEIIKKAIRGEEIESVKEAEPISIIDSGKLEEKPESSDDKYSKENIRRIGEKKGWSKEKINEIIEIADEMKKTNKRIEELMAKKANK